MLQKTTMQQITLSQLSLEELTQEITTPLLVKIEALEARSQRKTQMSID